LELFEKQKLPKASPNRAFEYFPLSISLAFLSEKNWIKKFS
jgi:hypothetical protein